MRDVSEKFSSLRYAKARGSLRCSLQTLQRIRAGTVPKGDVIETARLSAIAAAKKTSDLLIFCHPIPLDWIEAQVELSDTPPAITITVEVKSVWKTGVEMEALTAVSVALLNVYDMLKPIDEDLEIQQIRLLRKTGGKRDFLDRFKEHIRVGILVVSTSTALGKRADKAGAVIREFLADYPVEIEAFQIVPDEEERITTTIREWVDQRGIQLILTAGGTGLGPYDRTPEATLQVADREIPGIGEAMRAFGQQRTQFAMLSRGVVCQRGNALIVNLPGSTRGVLESLQAIFPGILHAFVMMAARKHDEQAAVHQAKPEQQ